jgi:ribosomal protein L37AE/L43A
MICPNCNADIQDNSKFCSSCGKEIFAGQTDDIQVQLAKAELQNDEKTDETPAQVFSVVCFLGIIAVIIFKPSWSIIAIPILLFFGVGFAHSARITKAHKEELKQIASGKKIVNVCPKCKSPDIEMSMVQTGGFTSHGTTRIADNINPLHPLTHTNVKKGNDYTSYSYGNQCHCRNCGYVFAKPEVHYM